MKNPRIKLLGIIGGLKVYRVDGDLVRENIDKDFTNFGQHYRFKFIPDDELWLDGEGLPNELPFFLTHLLVENWAMKMGMSYDKALALADKEEKAVRYKSDKYKEAPTSHPEQIKKIQLKKILTFKGIDIYDIDDELVRDLYRIDFTEGGHDKVYSFIPKNTIWISQDLDFQEKIYTIIHEYTERFLMVRGMSYNRAHIIALRFEWQAREENDRLQKENL